MQLWTQLAVLGLVLLAGRGAEARSLRRYEVSAREDPNAPAEIHEKWDKLDEFLKIMFTIGCKWKHQKDVHASAAQGLKDGTMTMDEFQVDLEATQDKEVAALKRACGMINAAQMKKCREGCATRWNEKMGDRDACDEACVSTNNKFEEQCKGKADELKGIYAANAKRVEAKQKCYSEWCPDFPTLYTMTDESKMEDELVARCGTYCAEEKIKMRCEKGWQLKVDFVMGGVKSKCSTETTVTACFAKGKGKVNEEQEACKKDAGSTCDEAKKECETKGDTSKAAKDAQAFCDKRWKMCDEQATAKCLKQHEEGLDKLKKTCEKTSEGEFDKCVDEALAEKEKTTVAECEEKRGKTCPADCKAKCQVTKMTGCVSNLEQTDATKDFCEDFWRIMEGASETDPKTGDPKVESIAR